MYSSATMSFGDSALISLMGLTTVFLCLIALALAVMIFFQSFFVNCRPGEPDSAASPGPSAWTG